jgi:hypothetical protein
MQMQDAQKQTDPPDPDPDADPEHWQKKSQNRRNQGFITIFA